MIGEEGGVPQRSRGRPGTVGWLVAAILAAGAAFVVLRLLTPADGTQVPARTWAWTGEGVLVQAAPGGALRDRHLVTAVDGVALGSPVLWLYLLNTQVVYVAGWAGLVGFVALFPAPGRRWPAAAGCCRRSASPRRPWSSSSSPSWCSGRACCRPGGWASPACR